MSNWVIKIVEVQKREGLGSFFLFELFRKNSGGIDIPLTSTPEPLVLSEEHFHELTGDLMADVYNDGLLVVKDGCVHGAAEIVPYDIWNWMEGVETQNAGHFLTYVRHAATHADSENLIFMIPLLRKLKDKYPKYSTR